MNYRRRATDRNHAPIGAVLRGVTPPRLSASLWIPGPLPGLNELLAAAKGAGGTGRAYSTLKRQWTTTIWALAKSAQLDKPGPFQSPVSMRFEWAEPDRRRDPDNIAAGGRKLILDAFVKAGVLLNDGWINIGRWSDSWRVDSLRPGCQVLIVTMGTQ